jgi:hypothetical protein
MGYPVARVHQIHRAYNKSDVEKCNQIFAPKSCLWGSFRNSKPEFRISVVLSNRVEACVVSIGDMLLLALIEWGQQFPTVGTFNYPDNLTGLLSG